MISTSFIARKIVSVFIFISLFVPSMYVHAQVVDNTGGTAEYDAYFQSNSIIQYNACVTFTDTPFTGAVRVQDLTAGTNPVVYSTPAVFNTGTEGCFNNTIQSLNGSMLVPGHFYTMSVWEQDINPNTGGPFLIDQVDGTVVQVCAVNSQNVCPGPGSDDVTPNGDPDGDGIINQSEDANGNGNYYDDDSDVDGIANFLDPTDNTPSDDTNNGDDDSSNDDSLGSNDNNPIGLGDGVCSGDQAGDPDCIIPCDGGFGDECTFDDAMTLINRIINFMLFTISIPLAAIVFMVAGFKLMTAGGDTGARSKAIEMFKNVAIGLAIALAAWLIVKAVLVGLGYGAVPGEGNDLYEILNITEFNI